MPSSTHPVIGNSVIGPQGTSDPDETRAGDRGDASGRNIAQNRAIGQDDPTEGSRTGREQDKTTDYPGTPDLGTNAAQTHEATQLRRDKS